jgi:hypothetical protein
MFLDGGFLPFQFDPFLHGSTPPQAKNTPSLIANLGELPCNAKNIEVVVDVCICTYTIPHMYIYIYILYIYTFYIYMYVCISTQIKIPWCKWCYHIIPTLHQAPWDPVPGSPARSQRIRWRTAVAPGGYALRWRGSLGSQIGGFLN